MVEGHSRGDLAPWMANQLPTWVGDHEDLERLPVGRPTCITAAPMASEWEWAVGTEAGCITLHAGDRVAALAGHDSEILDLDWHPEGHLLVSTGDDHVVRVWNLEDSGPPSRVVGAKRPYVVDRVAWHCDGNYLALGGYHRKVEVWQTERLADEPTFTIDGHHMAWHPDGSRVLAVSQGATIVRWDLDQSDRSRVLLETAESSLWRMEWGAGGTLLALTDTSRTTRLWDLEGASTRPAVALEDAAAAAWAPTGSRLATTSPAGTRIWDGQSWDAPALALAGGRAVAWRPDGQVVAVADDFCTTWDPDGTAERLGTLPGHTTGVGGLSWSPTGRYLAAVGDDSVVRVWGPSEMGPRERDDLETGAVAQPLLLGEPRPCTCLAWSPEGTRLVTGHWDGGASTWDLEVPEMPLSTFEGHTDAVRTVAWSPDGARIASGSRDGTTCVWEVGVPVGPKARLSGHRRGVDALGWSRDGAWLATSSSDGTARVWEAENFEGALAPERPAHVLDHGDTVMTTLSWHPDSSHLATGHRGTGAQVWDLSVPEEPPAKLLWGQQGTSQVAWNPEGDLLATSSEDRVVYVGPIDGSEPEQLAGHAVWARAVAWSADGDLLATSDTAGIRLWRRDREQNRMVPAGAILPWSGGRPASGPVTQRGRTWADDDRDASGRLLPDRPIIDDVLGTDAIAEALDSLLRLRLAEEGGSTIAVHVDGEWGRGKSTLLAHLRRRRGERGDQAPWLVVTHDAWRHSRISPSWWGLARDLQEALTRDLSRSRRWWLAQRERLRRLWGAANTPAVLAVLACIAILAASLRWSDGWAGSRAQIVANDLVDGIEGVVAVVVVLVAGLALWRRTARWDRRGEGGLGRAEHEPLAAAADHVTWLRRTRRGGFVRPILFEVEELDRCPPEVVVEVLETVHTLMRPDKAHGTDTEHLAPIAFLVPADGRWIRRAYQVVHHRDSIPTEPDLGSHFHSKLFELAVPLPPISPRRHHALAAALCDQLTGQGGTRSTSSASRRDARTAARRAMPASAAEPPGGPQIRQDDQPLHAEGVVSVDWPPDRSYAARAQDRQASSATSAGVSTGEEIQQKTRHLLMDYAPLLPRNPRAHIRVINDWWIRERMNRELPPEEKVTGDDLVRWVILSQSWPDLASNLLHLPDLDRPETVTQEAVVAHLDAAGAELAPLLRSWPVRRVWPLLDGAEMEDDRHVNDEGDSRWVEALAKLAGAYPPYEPIPQQD